MKKPIITVDNADKLIAELEEDIKRIKHFKKLAEEYPSESIEEKIIKHYAQHGNASKVAQMLNDEGYMVDDRKWITKDVTNIIVNSKSKNELVKIVRAQYKRKIRKSY